ncbi:MFS transporter [Sphingomonas sp. OK281]|uniref:MFS transporter n=1 Tax=Sphingomonas sp. OK281 TaxID=1881067 RepID=UPI0008EBACD9|nr:MFS transporter [Sphingomonas sp. OK281]SFO17442.1 glycoside/pentoside/hexuronide:cation symporter, GPH family [Sphingomonas sp. OK281]
MAELSSPSSSSAARSSAADVAGARGPLLLFSAGDFAFNIYWQAISLYLLFYYIDALALPPATAGLVFMIGAIWDGVADFCAGAAVERTRFSYRSLVGWGALPLGLAFVAMFAVPASAALWALATQAVFRTAYAFTNIPYAAWTTRIAHSSADRSLVAGFRMGFGAAAGILVALALPRLVELTGSYGAATAVLAAIGVPLLAAIAWRVPEPMPVAVTVDRPRIPTALMALGRNRAFVTLNIAAAAASAATALTSQSVLYFFRYVLGDLHGGPRALAGMAVGSLVAVPVWTLLARAHGARIAWLGAGLLAIGLPVAFALIAAPGGTATAAFLFAMQAAFVGFGLASWTLLPDTVDWGEAKGGLRVEALAFGTFALVQKVALAGTGFAIGAVYQANGFVAGVAQSPDSLRAIRWLMLAGPVVLIAAMLVAVIAIPLRRDTLAGFKRA